MIYFYHFYSNRYTIVHLNVLLKERKFWNVCKQIHILEHGSIVNCAKMIKIYNKYALTRFK